MSRKPIIGIMAATAEGVIGASTHNGLPWDYPEELEIYRRTTAGAIIIAGRKTFQAMPEQAHKTRTPIVLSTTLREYMGCVRVARSPEEALTKAFAVASEQKIFMIGGAQTAASFLKNAWIDTFLLTRIHKTYPGDVALDLSLLAGWAEKVLHKTPDFTVCELTPPR